MKYFLIAVTGASVLSCSEDPASIGSAQIPKDIIISEINSIDDSIAQTSSFFQEEIERGISSRIFLGRFNDLESHALYRFIFSLPDSITSALESDSLNILEAKIKMHPVYELGEGTFDFSVHKINSSWTETAFDSDSLNNLQYDAADLSTEKTFTDSLITFSLPLDLASDWLYKKVDDSIEDNNGLYLQPSSGSQKIIGFRGFSGDPADLSLTSIEIIVEKPGEFTDTVYAFGFPDVYIPKAEVPVADGNIFIQGGIALQSKINFDISGIPKSAIINNAELKLFIDEEKSYLGDPTRDSLFVRFNLQDSVEQSGIYFRRVDDYFTGPVTGFVQDWVSGTENNGLNISIYNETNTLSRYALYGSGINDPLLKPVLTIYYTTLK